LLISAEFQFAGNKPVPERLEGSVKFIFVPQLDAKEVAPILRKFRFKMPANVRTEVVSRWLSAAENISICSVKFHCRCRTDTLCRRRHALAVEFALSVSDFLTSSLVFSLIA